MSYYTFNKVLSGIESKTCLTVQSLANPEYVYDFIPFLLGFFLSSVSFVSYEF